MKVTDEVVAELEVAEVDPDKLTDDAFFGFGNTATIMAQFTFTSSIHTVHTYIKCADLE